MGICTGSPKRAAEGGNTAETKDIDKMIRDEKQQMKNMIKILLIGAGEAGKTTILNQMRIIHDKGFSKSELQSRKPAIYAIVFSTMFQLLHLIEENGENFEFDENDAYARAITEFVNSNGPAAFQTQIPDRLFVALEILWKDDKIRRCYEENKKLLVDNVDYFFDSLSRLSKTDYEPTVDDILYSRVITTGVTETKFILRQKTFRVFDVGGQRPFRKKWLSYFDDVTALLFIVALSEFNQVLQEDGVTNRMVESLNLCESTCNSHWFINTSCILFLNKTDLFEEKLKAGATIKMAFEDYQGTSDYRESLDFVREKFENVNKDKIISHETCATDTDKVEIVLDDVIFICMEKSVTSLGMQ